MKTRFHIHGLVYAIAVFAMLFGTLQAQSYNLAYQSTAVAGAGTYTVTNGEVWRITGSFKIFKDQWNSVEISMPVLVQGGTRFEVIQGVNVAIEKYLLSPVVPLDQFNAQVQQAKADMDNAKNAYLQQGAAIPINMLQALLVDEVKKQIVAPYESRIKALEAQVADLQARLTQAGPQTPPSSTPPAANTPPHP